MTEAALAVVIALGLTVAAAPLVRSVMLRRGVLDLPNHRSSHTVPTPRGGGLACAFAVAVTTVGFGGVGVDVLWAGVGVAMVLAAVGFLDDRRTLRPAVRLAAQIVAGAVLGALVGGGWWIALGILVTASAVNVVNFMDGINGITALTMTVWGVTASLVGLADGLTGLTVLGAVTSGAALGFLPSNVPTAKLFLGDVGSYLFGGLVAAGILYGWSSGASVVLLVAPLSLYLVDTATVLVRRAARGAPVLEAHREHVYQRLVAEARMTHVVVAAGAAGLAATVTASWATGVVWFAGTVAVVVCLGYLFTPRLTRLLGTHSSTSLGPM